MEPTVEIIDLMRTSYGLVSWAYQVGVYVGSEQYVTALRIVDA